MEYFREDLKNNESFSISDALEFQRLVDADVADFKRQIFELRWFESNWIIIQFPIHYRFPEPRTGITFDADISDDEDGKNIPLAEPVID